jgi:hypothetical protein
VNIVFTLSIQKSLFLAREMIFVGCWSFLVSLLYHPIISPCITTLTKSVSRNTHEGRFTNSFPSKPTILSSNGKLVVFLDPSLRFFSQTWIFWIKLVQHSELKFFRSRHRLFVQKRGREGGWCFVMRGNYIAENVMLLEKTSFLFTHLISRTKFINKIFGGLTIGMLWNMAKRLISIEYLQNSFWL